LVILERADSTKVLDLEALPKVIDPTILVKDTMISG